MKVKLLVVMLALGFGLTSCEKKAQDTAVSQNQMFMAPDVISAIVDGSQPPDLTGRKIMRINKISLDWADQRKMFGFPAA